MTEEVRCCDNPKSVLRCRINAGGVPYALTQCKSCGYYGSKGYRAVGKKDWPNWITSADKLPKFDEEAFQIAHARMATRANKALRDAIGDRGNPHAYDMRVKLAQEDLARREAERAERAPYYHSEAWAMVRTLHDAPARGVCEGCCISPATEVHHMTYENFGKEFLWELRAVCKACHDRFHEPQKRRDDAIRRGELPHDTLVGPMLTRIVERLEVEEDENEEGNAA